METYIPDNFLGNFFYSQTFLLERDAVVCGMYMCYMRNHAVQTQVAGVLDVQFSFT